MEVFAILCVEDEPEVRDAIVRDLEGFEPVFRIEVAEDADDARMVMQDYRAKGSAVALILCDHLLPGMRGVEFLVELTRAHPVEKTRKVLLTGQAGHEDTIQAINEAGLDHYIAKPWSAPELRSVVLDQLTEFVLAAADDLLPYVAILDGARLLEAVAERRGDQ